MTPKRFLFVSVGALIGDLAWRVQLEGHEVKYFIESKEEKTVADGFVPKVEDWKREVDWAEVIVFDDVMGQGKFAAELRGKGKAVIGGTPTTDRLEDQRSFGQQELKKAGVNIIPQVDFTSFEEAIQYVEQNPGQYVIKSNVETSGDKKILFIGEEEQGADVISVLNDYKTAWGNTNKGFQLQRRVKGVEIAVGAFFNGTQFLEPINVNFEHKRLFPGDIGPQTGEMGTSMFWSKPNRLFNMTLKKIEMLLKEEGYVGYIDINCIVNGRGVYPLEFTARFGYPTIFIQQEGILDPIGEFLFRLANKETFSFKTASGFQIGVRIAAPPYPFDDPETFNQYTKDTIIIFKNKNTQGVHFEDAKLVKGEWVITGSSGVILTAVGKGSTMREAQKQAYKRVENIIIPNMYYRTDIGNRWYEDGDLLHSWGYLREN